jgi:hypothetical protein
LFALLNTKFSRLISPPPPHHNHNHNHNHAGAKKGWTHSGVELCFEGFLLTSHPAGKGDNNNNESRTCLMKSERSLVSAGKFSEGFTEIPFSMVLKESIAQGGQGCVTRSIF